MTSTTSIRPVLALSAIAIALTTQQAVAASPEELRLITPQASEKYFDPSIFDDLVALPTEENDVEVRISGPHYYKQSLTSTKPRTMSSEKFETLPGARTRIVLAPGDVAQVNVAFTAESRCNEPGSAAQDWCEVRILVDGVEAAPAASSFPMDTFAFDSTDHGTETVASWEAHAMDRHKCVRNTGDTPRAVPVEVQWRVTNFDGGAAPSFWLDDWSLTIELAKGCEFRAVKFPDEFEPLPFKTK